MSKGINHIRIRIALGRGFSYGCCIEEIWVTISVSWEPIISTTPTPSKSATPSETASTLVYLLSVFVMHVYLYFLQSRQYLHVFRHDKQGSLRLGLGHSKCFLCLLILAQRSQYLKCVLTINASLFCRYADHCHFSSPVGTWGRWWQAWPQWPCLSASPHRSGLAQATPEIFLLIFFCPFESLSYWARPSNTIITHYNFGHKNHSDCVGGEMRLLYDKLVIGMPK